MIAIDADRGKIADPTKAPRRGDRARKHLGQRVIFAIRRDRDKKRIGLAKRGDGISDLVRAPIEREGIDAFGVERYRLRGAAHRSADAPSLGALSAREDGGRIAKAQDEEVHGPTRPSLD